MFKSILFNENFIAIATIIMFCVIALGEALPKEYKAGNTFLNYKLKRLEITLEIIIMFILAWILVIIL